MNIQTISMPEAKRHRKPVNRKKLRKRLRRRIGQAIEDYHMIQQGDRIMVCVSGGKDSYTLLDMLLDLRSRAPIDYEIIAVNMDQKQPGFPEHVLPEYLQSLGIPFDIIERDTYSVVKKLIPEGKSMCSLCSRLRRGTLYGYAEAHGISKIALGHHREDIMETLFLNMFHQGSLKAMPPILRSDNGRNVVIRPLAYCSERDIARHSHYEGYPIIPCNLCGSQDNLQRQKVKEMLHAWEGHPGRIENIFRSMFHVSPSQLSDKRLFDFDQFANGNRP